ncbi:MAG: selenocysteine-specific translation elongation factor [Acetobacterales bacterium]
MIVATAGHIDHGKTLLVKALTGVDADRLPEEKVRGMSIDLGFAYAPIGPGNEVLGFVDVPGHEKFVRNMLAGVPGIDVALLVVAADDGPMPQTREHLAILDLLDISAGVVAITKTDRVDASRLRAVEREIADLLAGTALDGAPVFAVSAVTGAGVDALRDHLHAAAGEGTAIRPDGWFRLAVDRRFTVAGAGLVVTGTVLSGFVRPGDELLLAPEGVPVRVRGLRAQDRDAGSATVGQRCALNIAGSDLRRTDVRRGQWLVSGAIHAPTARIDLRLRVLPSEQRSLKHWTPVHVHIGADDIPARVAVLEGREIAPGQTGLAQLVLDRATVALFGDRPVLRDQSATRTIAGGTVIEPFGATRGRARPERLALLRAQETPDAAAALAGALPLSPEGVPLARFELARNLSPEAAARLRAGTDMAVAGATGAETAFSLPAWEDTRTALVKALEVWHGNRPDHPGPQAGPLRKSMTPPPPRPLFDAALDALVAEGAIGRTGPGLQRAGFRPTLPPEDARLWTLVGPVLDKGGMQPPVVHDMARDLGVDPENLRRFLRRAAAFGLVAGVADNRFLKPVYLRRLAEIAETLAREKAAGFDARMFRDRAGVGRNITIQILESFDAAGFTRRSGDLRTLVRPRSEVFP